MVYLCDTVFCSFIVVSKKTLFKLQTPTYNLTTFTKLTKIYIVKIPFAPFHADYSQKYMYYFNRGVRVLD